MNIRGDRRGRYHKPPAVYNIYNAAGALTAATEMGVDVQTAIRALGRFKCGFGRMEKIRPGRAGARMMLIKKPCRPNQVLEFLRDIRSLPGRGLNDRSAGRYGHSWIWDAEFEELAGMDRREEVILSGDRAADMQVRMKYAGCRRRNCRRKDRLKAAGRCLQKREEPVFIMPTYTAMLELREHLIKRCGGAKFWE